jgi:hypothetical protein
MRQSGQPRATKIAENRLSSSIQRILNSDSPPRKVLIFIFPGARPAYSTDLTSFFPGMTEQKKELCDHGCPILGRRMHLDAISNFPCGLLEVDKVALTNYELQAHGGLKSSAHRM